MLCHLDIESYSEANLKKEGLYRYAEDTTTEITVVCFAFGDGPVNVWVPLDDLPPDAIPRPERIGEGELYVQPRCPAPLKKWVKSRKQLGAHNAQFERKMTNGPAGKAIGFPKTTIDQWICTAAKCAAAGLPRALGNAAKAAGTYPKEETGRMNMLALAKPRTGKEKRYLIAEHPDRYRELYEYCIDDVHAERGLDEYVPDLSDREIQAYTLDQLINDRGIQADTEAVSDAQFLISEYKARLEAKCVDISGLTPTQTAALAEWIRAQGCDIPNLQKETVKTWLKKELPEKVRKILKIRTIHAMKAVSKFEAIARAVMDDDRLRGMFLYHGAATGRWSSFVVQLQNLFRPVIKDVDDAILTFKMRDLDWLRGLWKEDAMRVIASCVRGMLIPAKGKFLMALDYSAIEARIVAWLAGQMDVLEIFEKGGDVYKYAAARIFNVDVEDVTDWQRFIGKIAVLALGYQGGRKAFTKMSAQHGVEIDEFEAEEIKVDWRLANPKIVSLWYKMERAAIAAVANPGQVFSVAKKRIMFKVKGDWLYMRLPSGRHIAYYKPQINHEGQLTYLGTDTYTRRWCRVVTYGGRLTENAVQAIARDLLLHAMFKLESNGFDIIGTVHDEVILEVDDKFAEDLALESARKIMCRKPKWADGLPVAATGYHAQRYRKD